MKSNVGKFLGILFLCSSVVVFLNFLFPELRSVLTTLYYFTPLIAVLFTEKGDISKVFNKYKVNFRDVKIKNSLFYILIIAFIFPVLNILCVVLFGNILHVEQFGRFSIPEGNFIMHGISISDNILIRFLSVYFDSVLFSFIGGLTFNMIFSLGNEIGWRGFLNYNIKSGFIKKNIIIGVIWGTWFFYGPGKHPDYMEIVTTYAFFLVLSFLLDLVFKNTKSLFIPSAIGGIIISSSWIFFLGGESVKGFSGITEITGIVSLIILCVCFYWISAIGISYKAQ